MTRARFLRARLAADLDSAEVDYLWVAVEGGGIYGPLARLRLAQLHAARGSHERAEADLERLRADFPEGPHVLASWLWTGNIRADLKDMEGACAAWERALREPERSGTTAERELVQTALELCAPDAASVARRPGFAVQLGAFRSRQAALDLRDRAAAEGITARVVEPVDPGGLFRVWSGSFARREDAARHAVRLVADGFEAIVVPEEP
jgi:tetratricopeptide (TPR) repeat protein